MASSSDPNSLNPTLADWLATVVDEDAPVADLPPRLPTLRLSGESEPNADLWLGDLLGVGGMAVVTRADQRALGRDVAVKRSRQAANPRAVRALLREAWITGQLDHPNVVPVHLVGETPEGEPVVVLRAIGGASWSERIQSDPATSPEARNRHLAVFVAVCNAVHFAHERGFLHRDVKPANVQIGSFGEVYLLDWGIAASMSDTVLPRAGTPAYMAPEMLDRCAPDRRSDVYLLGATLVEVLTGAPPRDGAATSEILDGTAVSLELSLDPGMQPGLRALLTRATATRVEDRFATALDLRDAVLAWEVEQGVASLLEAATSTLEAFEQGAARSEQDVGDDLAAMAARERFAAARFGFEQVLAERPEHPEAVVGLGRSMERMVRFELAHGAVTNARALLAALPTAPEALVALVATRAAELEASQAEQARLSRLAKAYDTQDVARDWLILLSACTASVALSIVGANLVLDRESTHGLVWMTALLGPMLLSVALVIVWKRASLVYHPVGQRLTVSVCGLLVVMVASRLAQLGAGVSGPMLALGEPFLISVWILGNSAYLRRLVPVGAVGVAGAVINTLLLGNPWQATWQNSLSVAVALAFSAVWWQTLRARGPTAR